MTELITPQEKKRLTEYEIGKLNDISHRQQPTCPGCGHDMVLYVSQDITTEDEWMVSYICPKVGGCGKWQTTVSKGRGVAACCEDAYKTAMRRVEE